MESPIDQDHAEVAVAAVPCNEQQSSESQAPTKKKKKGKRGKKEQSHPKEDNIETESDQFINSGTKITEQVKEEEKTAPSDEEEAIEAEKNGM